MKLELNPINKLAIGSLLVAALVLQIPLRRSLDRTQQAQPAEWLYVSSGTLLRHMSFGYEGLLADVYWTRVVQYYGREHLSKHPRFQLLGPLLRTTTTLDPHLLVAYRFGAIFLAEKPPDGAGKPAEALELLRRGIVANSGYWRFWEDMGFVYYWDLHDYAAAGRMFATGSERPGAEIWMKTLAAAVAAKGGEIHTSQVLWSQIYRTAENGSICKNAVEHLAALKALEDLRALDRLLFVYKSREGYSAKSFRDLMSAGILHGMPIDPSSSPYVIGTDGTARLGPGSRVDLKLLQQHRPVDSGAN
ncbi:MAG: hypothetical protein ACRD2B_08755 [Terriglobia bacterium]